MCLRGLPGNRRKPQLERTEQVKVRKALILVGPGGIPGGLGVPAMSPLVWESRVSFW